MMSFSMARKDLWRGTVRRPDGTSLLSPFVCRRHKSGPYGYTQAKALVYSAHGEPIDVLSLHTHSISPSIPSTSLLLRMLAAPVNPADINQIQGVYPSQPRFTSLLGTSRPSAIGGNEGCFEVVTVGSSVKNFTKGDWVITKRPCFGTWRTHALVDEESTMRIDRQGLSPAQVCTISVNPCTAYRMLKDFVELREDDWWIQNGANSSVGRAAIQLGKFWGLRSINVIRDRPDPAATEVLRSELLELGATHVLTEAELMGRGLRDRVMEWTDAGRQRIKLGLNCVGGKPTAAMVKCLSKGAHLVTYGGMSRQPLQLATGKLIFDDLRFSGFWVSRWAAENAEAKQRTVDDLLTMVRDGSFRDAPSQEIKWNWDVDEQVLKAAVQGTLDGFRGGKSILVTGDT